MKVEVVAFDVNETLLDLSAMSAPFTETMGPKVSMREWFARLLHRSVVMNELGDYRPFGDLGIEVLKWMAERDSIPLPEHQAAELVSHMTRLPPHPDVRGGLESLSGRRLVALTNGSQQVAAQQLANAGLDGFFEATLSVDAVGRFKPDPVVYRYAAESCGVTPERLLLVAAHDWDVAGAQAVGASGCFVKRQPWGIGDVEADMEVEDIAALAYALEDR